MINKENFIEQLNKIKLYNNSEILFIEEINNNMNNIHLSYMSENTEFLSDVNIMVDENLTKIMNNRKKYIDILEKVLTKYIETEEKVNNIFSDTKDELVKGDIEIE